MVKKEISLVREEKRTNDKKGQKRFSPFKSLKD